MFKLEVAVLGFRCCSIKIVYQLLDDPELLKYINMIYNPASKQIPIGIFKDKNRPIFILNRVVDGFYNNSLRCWCFSVFVIQTRINKGKEEIKIVKYLLLRVVIIYILNKAKRYKQLLRCSFAFISYKKDKQSKEVLNTIRNYVLINKIFILIQLYNVYLFLSISIIFIYIVLVT